MLQLGLGRRWGYGEEVECAGCDEMCEQDRGLVNLYHFTVSYNCFARR